MGGGKGPLAKRWMSAAILGLADSLCQVGGGFYLACVVIWLLDFPESGYRAMMIGFTAGLAAVLPLRVWRRLRRLQTP